MRVGRAEQAHRRVRRGWAATLIPWRVLTLLCLLGGCYVYEPVGGVEPQVGSSIAAELTDAGADTLAPAIGPRVVELRGRVTRVEGGAVTLAVSSAADQAGRVTAWTGEEVVLPRFALRAVAEKKLSRGRTAVVAVAGIAGSLILWEAFEGRMSGGSRPGGPGGGEPQ